MSTKEARAKYWAENKEKYNKKVSCDICRMLVNNRNIEKHKKSVKCQVCIPNHTVLPAEKVACDRCGKEATNMWKHKRTVKCKFHPALILNIPLKMAVDEVYDNTGSFIEENLKKICEKYKGGYVAPVKIIYPIKTEML